ncbi:DUF2975 domain-containing protein [Paenibacillus sp. NFR01]|uniref:DUF2975 domain-containing protein n=1 Tax=Paenibacillus sp. NFR01 TaxID=1566279 RepID=UPI0008B52147|nr:DUF2975 domain-containing protein [Paenibacillus sp. NFR01]SES90182.1 Protein of unknown function [Paenibacillus sp. NFR01]
MERGTTLFLRLTVIIIGAAVLALCIFGLPMIGREMADHYPDWWLNTLIAGMYVSAVPFYIALYQALRLLRYIDKQMAFSDAAVKALKIIKWCAAAICLLYAAESPVLYWMADKDDAPGILAIGLVIIFASLVIAVFAAVLQKLLKNAIDIKAENDLTV